VNPQNLADQTCELIKRYKKSHNSTDPIPNQSSEVATGSWMGINTYSVDAHSVCIMDWMSPSVEPVCPVLGPISFKRPTVRHRFHFHLYTDDTQIYRLSRSLATGDSHGWITNDVHSWMQSNWLQLNTKKTLLWYATGGVLGPL